MRNTLRVRASFRAVWSKTLKTRKGINAVITKRTSATVRAGLDYDNKASVQAGRADGSLPAVNAGLPWGEWAIFPHVITHKGATYLRMYPVTNAVPKVEYWIDGVPATREQCAPLCPVSEFPDRDDKPLECFTVKRENLIELDGVS